METLRDALLFVHLIGFGALFGGAFVQFRDEMRVVNAAMLYGALTQVLSGILSVGVIEGNDEEINHTKIAVKFSIGLVVALLCWVNRRKLDLPHGLFWGILALTVTNVGLAVFW
ncbi:MAG: hypothetical protein H0V02_08210 [Nocardioidaceae bacterium]|nr:hypothetical protein [Nocardioidaceae bacterium]